MNLWQGRVPRFCCTRRFGEVRLFRSSFSSGPESGEEAEPGFLAGAALGQGLVSSGPPGAAFPPPSPLLPVAGLWMAPWPPLAVLEAGLGDFDHILKNALESVEIPLK